MADHKQTFSVTFEANDAAFKEELEKLKKEVGGFKASTEKNKIELSILPDIDEITLTRLVARVKDLFKQTQIRFQFDTKDLKGQAEAAKKELDKLGDIKLDAFDKLGKNKSKLQEISETLSDADKNGKAYTTTLKEMDNAIEKYAKDHAKLEGNKGQTPLDRIKQEAQIEQNLLTIREKSLARIKELEKEQLITDSSGQEKKVKLYQTSAEYMAEYAKQVENVARIERQIGDGKGVVLSDPVLNAFKNLPEKQITDVAGKVENLKAAFADLTTEYNNTIANFEKAGGDKMGAFLGNEEQVLATFRDLIKYLEGELGGTGKVAEGIAEIISEEDVAVAKERVNEVTNYILEAINGLRGNDGFGIPLEISTKEALFTDLDTIKNKIAEIQENNKIPLEIDDSSVNKVAEKVTNGVKKAKKAVDKEANTALIEEGSKAYEQQMQYRQKIERALREASRSASESRAKNQQLEEEKQRLTLLEKEKKLYKQIWDLNKELVSIEQTGSDAEKKGIQDRKLQIQKELLAVRKEQLALGQNEATVEQRNEALQKIRASAEKDINKIYEDRERTLKEEQKIRDAVNSANQKASVNAEKEVTKAIEERERNLREEQKIREAINAANQRESVNAEKEITKNIEARERALQEEQKIRNAIDAANKKASANTEKEVTKAIEERERVLREEQKIRNAINAANEKASASLLKQIETFEASKKNTLLSNIQSGAITAGYDEKQIKNIKDAYVELQNVITDIRTTMQSDGDVSKYAKKWADVNKEINILLNSVNKITSKPLKFNGNSLDEAKRTIENLNGGMAKFVSQNESMESGITKLTYTIQRENGVVEVLNYGYNEATKTLVQYNSQQKQTITLADRLSKAFKSKSVELMAYLGTFASFYKLFETLRQGIAIVHEVDTAFTDLRKVAQESDDVLRQFANTAAFEIAEGIGSTGRDIIDLTADFERLGYALEDAQELAKNTGIYMNVGDITDSQEAMQELVSTMKGFGLQAEDSTRIVDEFNEVGNRFAISSAGIGEALQRSSASLSQANNSLEQSIALAVAANDVIQNPEQVGSALKTVSLRIRGKFVPIYNVNYSPCCA